MPQQDKNPANSQLALFAQDLSRVLVELRKRDSEISLAQRQMEAYARDLRTALEWEHQKTAQLRRSYYDTVQRLTLAASYRDQETGAHLERIGAYVRILVRALGLAEREAQNLSVAAALHDIGKIGIPDRTLRKPGPLDAAERRVIEAHTLIGAQMLEGSPSPHLQLAREIALTHHENWDGSGYLQSLRGEAIPLPGRIVRLADQYDALRAARPYKPAYDHQPALQVILHGDDRTKPSYFDPRLLEIFRNVHQEFDSVWQQFEEC